MYTTYVHNECHTDVQNVHVYVHVRTPTVEPVGSSTNQERSQD